MTPTTGGARPRPAGRIHPEVIFMRSFRALFAIMAVLAGVSLSADEGMWMPQQIPMLGDELKEMGLALDPAAFADLTAFPMNAIVSVGGCSAAFVSPEGLVATNHHCVFGALQYNSTPERDLLANGFLAKQKSEEVPALPTARVFVTTSIEDVTAAVTGKLKRGIPDAERAKTIDKRRRQIVKECEAQPATRCMVASFFGGETFLKLVQMEIRDVRLVYAPALGVGNFGDEEDNWMWPRHTGDFGFYRAYVGKNGAPADYSPENVPYRPRHHLKLSSRDLDPGDLILLAGYPGSTSRLVTSEEVRFAQELEMPTSIRYREALLQILKKENERGRDVELRNAARIASLENILKKFTGTLEAFARDRLLDEKVAAESRLEELIRADEAKARRYRAARDEWTGILARQARTRERDVLYGWLFTSSPMLAQASLVHRMSEERAKKKDDDRAEGYQERDWPRRAGEIRRMQRTIEPASDRAGLRWFLLESQKLPAGQRIRAIDDALAATGEGSLEARVDALLDRIYSATKMGDLDARLAMFEEPAAALVARGDSMVAFAASLRPLGAEIEEARQATRGAEYRLRPQLIAAVREMRGGRLAPDANGTLRVGFGVVKGYAPKDGTWYEPQTTIRGVLEKDTGVRPFDSPPKLLELARAGKFGPYADPDLGTLPVGFVSTVNVTNGSSGSSALNAWGEITGLAFDMNWEGVAADWVVNEDVVRTVNVDSRYMLWVMDAVDGAHELLEEMGLPVHFR
jgi:hypothetical protein